jgi:hypothetical protein
MAGMTASFAVGQIAGPLLVSRLAGADGDVSAGLLVAGVLLAASAWTLHSLGRRLAFRPRRDSMAP